MTDCSATCMARRAGLPSCPALLKGLSLDATPQWQPSSARDCAMTAFKKPLVSTTISHCCLWGHQEPPKLADPCCVLLQDRAA